MDENELLYQVALTLVPNIGDVLGRELLQCIPNAQDIFKASFRQLSAIPGIGEFRARSIRQFCDFRRAEEEIAFLRQQQIRPVFFTDKDYPKRLQHCYDAPLMLYYKGNADLNRSRIIGIVGTRHCTAHGKACCEQLVHELIQDDVLIVSGLAYGIDICAHKAAIGAGIPTIGVVAHGLDRIYPPAHSSIARQMTVQGGLLTDFMSGTTPDKQNFPRRNRIVAGLSDAIIVVESGLKGGSLITAEIANSYSRDVFAFPGRTSDPKSEGCHFLIRKNKAALITNAADLREMMGWNEKKISPSTQRELFLHLSGPEKQIVELFSVQPALHIDEIHFKSRLPASQMAAAILNLELQGVLRTLPGKLYELA